MRAGQGGAGRPDNMRSGKHRQTGGSQPDLHPSMPHGTLPHTHTHIFQTGHKAKCRQTDKQIEMLIDKHRQT